VFSPDLISFAFLISAAFAAGLVDAAVGGGGLIQLPALLAAFPGVPVPLLLGTNKLSSCVGTMGAAARYARSVPLQWRAIAWTATMIIAAAFFGAFAATKIPSDWMRPLSIVLLIAMWGYTLAQPHFGGADGTIQSPHPALNGFVGVALGFYEGFFGPGFGSFLLFFFVRSWGMGFLQASAHAKLINLGTNLVTLGYFAYSNHVMWRVGALMALGNLAGGQIGARLAIARGSRFVRILFLLVVAALIVKLLADWWARA
jgi:uncharacterized protein